MASDWVWSATERNQCASCPFTLAVLHTRFLHRWAARAAARARRWSSMHAARSLRATRVSWIRTDRARGRGMTILNFLDRPRRPRHPRSKIRQATHSREIRCRTAVRAILVSILNSQKVMLSYSPDFDDRRRKRRRHRRPPLSLRCPGGRPGARATSAVQEIGRFTFKAPVRLVRRAVRTSCEF